MDDGAGNLLGKTLLTEGLQYPGDIFHVCLGQPLCGALATGGVHPHIERTIFHKAEAALGIIQLGRRDPQIQQEAIHLAEQTALIQIGGDAGEGAVHDFKTGILNFGRLGNRLRIAVDGDQSTVGAKVLQDQTRVTTTAKSTVDVDTVRLDGQTFNGFVQQHCDVFSGLGHL